MVTSSVIYLVDVLRCAKVLIFDNTDRSALHYAARWYNTNVDVIRSYILEFHANIDAHGEKNRTPLHYAAWCYANADIIRYLVTECGTDVNAVDALQVCDKWCEYFDVGEYCGDWNISSVSWFIQFHRRNRE